MFINKKWDKYSMVRSYNGILSSLKKEQRNVQICNNSQGTITSKLSNEQRSMLIKTVMMGSTTMTYEVFLQKNQPELIKL